jgi:hypothetical protein
MVAKENHVCKGKVKCLHDICALLISCTLLSSERASTPNGPTVKKQHTTAAMSSCHSMETHGCNHGLLSIS